MGIIRSYGHGLKIVGQTLVTDDEAIAGYTRTFSRTWPMTGASTEYKTAFPTLWTPTTAYPEDTGRTYPVTAKLGDGTDVPYFYFFGTAGAASVTRASGWLTWVVPTLTNPATSSPSINGAGNYLVIPMPQLEAFDLDFSLRTNMPTYQNFGSRPTSLYLDLLQSSNISGASEIVARIQWDGSTTNTYLEQMQTLASTSGTSNIASPPSMAAFISSGVLQRRYRISRDGPMLQIYGQPAGGGSFSLLRGRIANNSILREQAFSIVLSGSAGGTVQAPTYSLEIGNIVLNGVRSLY